MHPWGEQRESSALSPGTGPTGDLLPHGQPATCTTGQAQGSGADPMVLSPPHGQGLGPCKEWGQESSSFPWTRGPFEPGPGAGAVGMAVTPSIVPGCGAAASKTPVQS